MQPPGNFEFFRRRRRVRDVGVRSEEHTSELQSHLNLVCRLLLEKKKHRWATTTTPLAPRTRTAPFLIDNSDRLQTSPMFANPSITTLHMYTRDCRRDIRITRDT